jgi:hypothetical protein
MLSQVLGAMTELANRQSGHQASAPALVAASAPTPELIRSELQLSACDLHNLIELWRDTDRRRRVSIEGLGVFWFEVLENRQSVLIGNEGDRIDPPFGFPGLVEHKLAARCSAVDVVDRSGCEDAGLSRHRRSPSCVDGTPS